MAPVPKRKHSTRRKGKRMAKKKTALPSLTVCKECGKRKRPHRVCRHCNK